MVRTRTLLWCGAVGGPLFLAWFFLASTGFSQQPDLVAQGGLLQRITIVLGWTWLTVLALSLLSRLRRQELV